jgi:hypothetical protein
MALALAAPVAASGRVAIDHAPVDCVPYDRYARITATAVPAEAVAAHLQFRAGGEAGWYSVAMAAEGTKWSAFLPRPIQPLARLEYRIVMRSSDASEVATPAIPVPVGGDAKCAGSPAQSSAEVAAPIVVRVPEGAPLVPPVPAGFSPAGVVAAEDPVRSSRLKTAVIGAGLAGGVAAAVALGDEALTLSDLLISPTFAFSGTTPQPGSVLSVGDPLSVFVVLSGRSGAPFALFWTFDLLGGEDVCASISGRASAPTVLPATVTLSGLLFPVRPCGERFDVDRGRLRVTFAGRTIFVDVPAIPFHFEP